MAPKAPAFQFYPKDFLSDDAVSMMTSEQIGAYVLLLCHAWLKPDGLPHAMSSLAKLARCTERRFTAQIWPAIGDCFVELDGRLINPRLETERLKQDDFRRERSESGKRGAASKYGRLSDGSATREPLAKSSSSLCSLRTAVQEPPNPPLRGGRLTRKDRKRAEDIRHANGGCFHDPRCISAEVCLRVIALSWRGEKVSA